MAKKLATGAGGLFETRWGLFLVKVISHPERCHVHLVASKTRDVRDNLIGPIYHKTDKKVPILHTILNGTFSRFSFMILWFHAILHRYFDNQSDVGSIFKEI